MIAATMKVLMPILYAMVSRNGSNNVSVDRPILYGTIKV